MSHVTGSPGRTQGPTDRAADVEAEETLLAMLRNPILSLDQDHADAKKAPVFSMRTWAAARRRLQEERGTLGSAAPAPVSQWDTSYVPEAQVVHSHLHMEGSALLDSRRPARVRAGRRLAAAERGGHAEELPCLDGTTMVERLQALKMHTAATHGLTEHQRAELPRKLKPEPRRAPWNTNESIGSVEPQGVKAATVVQSSIQGFAATGDRVDYGEMRRLQAVELAETKGKDEEYKKLLDTLDEHMASVRYTFGKMLDGNFVLDEAEKRLALDSRERVLTSHYQATARSPSVHDE